MLCLDDIFRTLNRAALSGAYKERRMSAMRHNFNPAANAMIGVRQDCLLSARLR